MSPEPTLDEARCELHGLTHGWRTCPACERDAALAQVETLRAEVAQLQRELAEEKVLLRRASGLISEGDVALEKAQAERDRAQGELARVHGNYAEALGGEHRAAERAERALAAANAKIEAVERGKLAALMEQSIRFNRRLEEALLIARNLMNITEDEGVGRLQALLSAPSPGESVSVQEPERETGGKDA